MPKRIFLIGFVLAQFGCVMPPKKSKEAISNPDTPKLLKPIVKKIWVPPEIRNGGQEWVEGHYMYRIEKETTWSR